MALSVSLKFSLFGTKYKISSVTRQPVGGTRRGDVQREPALLIPHVSRGSEAPPPSMAANQSTVEAADTSDVQVPQDGVSPQVQVVGDGL